MLDIYKNYWNQYYKQNRIDRLEAIQLVSGNFAYEILLGEGSVVEEPDSKCQNWSSGHQNSRKCQVGIVTYL